MSRILPAVLALAFPAVLEGQITFTPEFTPGSLPGSWIATGTYHVPDQCKNLDTFTFLGARNSSGGFSGTTSFISATPPATAVTPQSGGVLAEFRSGMPDNQKIEVNVTLPTGTTQATLAVGISIGGSPTCSNPSLSFPIPIVAGPNLTITKAAFGGGGPIPDEGNIYRGQDITFVVTVKNVGTAPTIGDALIEDLVPDGFEVQHASALLPDGTTDDSFSTPDLDQGIVEYQRPIAPGDSVILRITARVGSSTPGPIPNTATVSGGGDPNTPKSATLTLVNHVIEPPSTCAPKFDTLCLLPFVGGSGREPGPGPLAASATGRFQVRVYWSAVHQRTSGVAQAVPLTSDTGYFWFFSANNVELVIKVLDGRPVNGKFWVFYGALSNVEYIIEVVDSVTGVVQGYFNPQDSQASLADTIAFGSATTAGTESEFQFVPMNVSDTAGGHPKVFASEPVEAAVASACVADALTLCLNGGRFQVRVHWQALHLGTSGEGQAVPITSDTGYLWFFSANNVELVIKVLDGRAVNGKFWVFYGALSNVQYTITITDTLTGTVKQYFNPQDTQASVSDTSAF